MKIGFVVDSRKRLLSGYYLIGKYRFDDVGDTFDSFLFSAVQENGAKAYFRSQVYANKLNMIVFYRKVCYVHCIQWWIRVKTACGA